LRNHVAVTIEGRRGSVKGKGNCMRLEVNSKYTYKAS
jgi:hypothetical protein